MTRLYTSVVDTLLIDGVIAKYVKKRIAPVSALDAHGAKRVLDGLEALFVDVNTKALSGLPDWSKSQGFVVTPEPLELGGGGRTRLQLQLTAERYRDVFRTLCDDICAVLRDASGEREAIQLLHQRLVRWQSFLKKHGPEGLSGEARCGLVGELIVLRDLLLPALAEERVIRAWRGCKKAHQDFQFADCAIEVKATRATIPDRISVSNVQQLDCDLDGIGVLFLSVVHLHENDTAGETLPEIVDQVRGCLDDESRDLLDAGLVEVGYLDVHRELYVRERYQFLDWYYFRVRPGFPRMTLDMVPDGVKGLRYEVSLDACKPFRSETAQVLATLTRSSEAQEL